MAVKVIGTFKAKENVADGLQNNLGKVLKNHTSTFKGYLSGKVYRDEYNVNNVVLVEEWESAEDFKAYIESYSDEDNANMMRALTSAPNFVILNEVG